MDFFRKRYRLREAPEDDPKIALYQEMIEDCQARIKAINELSSCNRYGVAKEVLKDKIKDYHKKIKELQKQ